MKTIYYFLKFMAGNIVCLVRGHEWSKDYDGTQYCFRCQDDRPTPRVQDAAPISASEK